jgi:hypothetical protein
LLLTVHSDTYPEVGDGMIVPDTPSPTIRTVPPPEAVCFPVPLTKLQELLYDAQHGSIPGVWLRLDPDGGVSYSCDQPSFTRNQRWTKLVDPGTS